MRTAPAPTVDVGDPDWTEPLARAGLVARAVVYGVFGAVAVRLAFLGSTGGEEASTGGAFAELVEKPLGSILVGATVVGLLAWGAVCLIAVASGRNGSKPGPSDTLDRVRDAIRGGASLALAVIGVRVLTQGESAGSGGGGEREATARLMDAPAGQVLVGAIGLALLGVGLYQVVKALRRDFLDHVDLGRLGRLPRRPLELLGVAGHVGKGLVFAVVGGFVLKAAVEHDPDESKGIDAALRDLAGGGPGRVLLVVMSLGLVCFGVWCLVEARTRHADV